MMETNTDVVRTFYDGLSAGDIDSAFAKFASTIDWREADGFPYSDGNPYTRPEAVAAGVVGRIVRDWEAFTASPERFFADGDTVVVVGRYRGVHRKTGKKLDVPMCHAWTVRGGRIRGFRQHVDTLMVQRATLWSMANPWFRVVRPAAGIPAARMPVGQAFARNP